MTVRFALAFVVAIAVFWAIVAVPPLLLDTRAAISEADRLKAANDLRGTLVTALAGGFAIGTLYFAARNLAVTQRGQVTDRFSKAVEQLGESGPQRVAVRIGAIYALEQIGRDSAELKEPISALLTTLLKTSNAAEIGPSFPPDLQTALTVLSRGERNAVRDGDRGLDLSGAVLVGADVTNGSLVNANLSNADLSESRLDGTDMSGADMRGARLVNANLSHAKLENALLTNANLNHVDLRYAQLNGARLEGADLRKAQLVGAVLRGANLASALLDDANLVDADFSGADLRLASGLTFDVFAVAKRDSNTKMTAGTAPD